MTAYNVHIMAVEVEADTEKDAMVKALQQLNEDFDFYIRYITLEKEE